MQDEAQQNVNPLKPESEPQPATTPSPLQGEGGLPADLSSEVLTKGEASGVGREEGQGEVVIPAASGTLETVPSNTQSLLARALAAIQSRKKVKLEKILGLAAQKRSITNDQVEKLLHVSDATATRYLATLVRQGRLKRVGHPKHARYEPV